jgi:hypothetical protein
MRGNLRILPQFRQVTVRCLLRLFLTLTLQLLLETRSAPQFLQILLDISLGSLILAFCAIFPAIFIQRIARSGCVSAYSNDCFQRLAILSLAKALVRDFRCFLGLTIIIPGISYLSHTSYIVFSSLIYGNNKCSMSFFLNQP